MKELIIQKNDASQRLDKFLLKAFPNLHKGALYKAVRNKKIKVNRKRAQFDQILQEGDHILLFLAPDLLETKPQTMEKRPDLDVVYEDENLIAANKPAGLLSVKDSAESQDTLNDRLLWHLYKNGEYDPAAEQSFRPALAHRLDRNTSGLVLAAKNAESARTLAEAIRERALKKSYLAVTRKKPVQGHIEVWLKKEGTKALISESPKDGYDSAIMDVHTIEEDPVRHLCLSQIDLHTGRFHQIRATLAHFHTPLARDVKYGDKKGKGDYRLQAWKISLENTPFEKPAVIEISKSERLSLKTLPADF